MTELARECDVFCRYLVDQRPSDYVRKKYRMAHELGDLGPPRLGFDSLLLRIARSSRWATLLVDTYSVLLARNSSVRRRLVLLLAILESCSPSCDFFDATESRSGRLVLVDLGLKGIRFSIVLVIGVTLLLPMQALLALFSRSSIADGRS